eukprot:SAG22_NODE_249_length_13894_cov_60.455455_12_plen_351_part_00
MCVAVSVSVAPGGAAIAGLEPFEDWFELDGAALAAATGGRYRAVLASDFVRKHGAGWAAAGVVGRCWMGRRGSGAGGDWPAEAEGSPAAGCMRRTAKSQPLFWDWLAGQAGWGSNLTDPDGAAADRGGTRTGPTATAAAAAAAGEAAGPRRSGFAFAEERWLPLAGDAATKLAGLTDRVIALDCAPARYPIGLRHDWLGGYLQPAGRLRAQAAAFVAREFGGRPYVAIHLRTAFLSICRTTTPWAAGQPGRRYSTAQCADWDGGAGASGTGPSRAACFVEPAAAAAHLAAVLRAVDVAPGVRSDGGGGGGGSAAGADGGSARGQAPPPPGAVRAVFVAVDRAGGACLTSV